MFTYCLQPRHMVGPTDKLSLPGPVTIEARFEPGPPFGLDGDAGHTTFGNPRMGVDWMTGRLTLQPEVDGPVRATAQYEGVPFRLDGNTLRATMVFSDRASLSAAIDGLHWLLPLTLSLRFSEPVRLADIRCLVEGAAFENRVKESSTMTVTKTSHELQGQRFQESLSDMALLQSLKKNESRPLMAALSHFRSAQRLLDAGDTYWDFMPETLLNLAKALEALWGDSTEAMKEGLQGIGLGGLADTVFIPIYLLRNQLDVAHAKLSMPDRTIMLRLYEVIPSVPRAYAKLFATLFESLERGEIPHRVPSDLAVSGSSAGKIERIVESLEAYVASVASSQEAD